MVMQVYRRRIWSMTIPDDPYTIYKPKFDAAIESRRLLIDWARTPDSSWYLDNEIAISIEKIYNPSTMETIASFYATMTSEQYELWREKEIIDKLQNSYNIKDNRYPY